MFLHYHLEGDPNNLGELQHWRQWNVSSYSDGGASTAKGILQYHTSNNEMALHIGSNVWKRFMMAGDSMATAGFSLAQNKIWVGDGSNVPQEVAKSAVSVSDWAAALVDISMNGHKVTGLADPTADTDAAHKRYVDQRVQGLKSKNSCLLATNQALPSCTYVGGTTLTLTATANAALTNVMVDSGAAAVTIAAGAEGTGSEFLVKNQAVSEQNGRYYLSQAGSAGTPWIMTRCSDSNTNLELKAAYTVIERGTYADQGWNQTSDDYDITAVTSKFITWVLFNVAGAYASGKGLITTGGNVFNFAKSTAYAAGDIFYGITGGAGEAATSKIDILAIGSAGRFMQVNTGATAPQWSSYSLPNTVAANDLLLATTTSAVTSLTTVNSRVLVTSAAGAVSWSSDLPTATTIGTAYIYRVSGTDISLADGGSGASLTGVAGGLVWTTSGTAMAVTAAAGAGGYFVRSGAGGTAAPVWYDLFGGTNTWTGLNTHEMAGSTVCFATKVTAAAFNSVEITTSGRILLGRGTAAPGLYIDGGADGETITLKNRYIYLSPIAASAPTIRFSNDAGTFFIGLKAAAAAGADKVWTLPSSGTGVWQADAGGLITCGTLAGSSVTGAALTKADDTNVTLTLGGTPATALLVAASITAGWTGYLAAARGGLGQATTVVQGGLLYASSATVYQCSAAGTTGQIPRSAGTGAPTWTTFTVPATMAINTMFVANAANVMSALAAVNNSVLTTNGSGVISWGGTLNVARNTAGGIARKFSNLVVGDAVNTYISVTHNLNTRDVIAGLRESNSGDTGSQIQSFSRITVEDANTVRVHFTAVVSASSYYVVTVIG